MAKKYRLCQKMLVTEVILNQIPYKNLNGHIFLFFSEMELGGSKDLPLRDITMP